MREPDPRDLVEAIEKAGASGKMPRVIVIESRDHTERLIANTLRNMKVPADLKIPKRHEGAKLVHTGDMLVSDDVRAEARRARRRDKRRRRTLAGLSPKNPTERRRRRNARKRKDAMNKGEKS